MQISPRLNAEVWSFPSGKSIYLFQQEFEKIFAKIPKANAIIITDENIFAHYGHLIKANRKIVIKAGEKYKSLRTILFLSLELIQMNADRDSHLIGFGGGVITDITGFLASSFMRGIKCSFVPTTLLAMVDAAIGGKNGVNVENNKNLVGSVRQPDFLFINTCWLSTLPSEEILSGLAEVAKYGFITEPAILLLLEHNAHSILHNQKVLYDLIRSCVRIKSEIVQRDEMSHGERDMLNFGHTLGHAIELLYKLPHGIAVSIGMSFALFFSWQKNNISKEEYLSSIALLKKIGLPVKRAFNTQRVMELLQQDKKKNGNIIKFILLENIGKASPYKINTEEIENSLTRWKSVSK